MIAKYRWCQIDQKPVVRRRQAAYCNYDIHLCGQDGNYFVTVPWMYRFVASYHGKPYEGAKRCTTCTRPAYGALNCVVLLGLS